MNAQIKYKGEIKLDGLVIPCYILEDGTRVLSGSAMQDVLKLQEDSPTKSGTRLARYLSQKSLNPFIYKDKEDGHFDPIICYDGSMKINGYEAGILIDICEGFLDARNNINLSVRQEIIAKQCEILVRAFAKVGIIALIDEATGYQYDRERDALQVVLQAYISEGLQKWQRTFPDIFYYEIFRLQKWDYTVSGIKKRPGVIGRWTTELVYNQLPKGVIDELKLRTPKSAEGNYTARFFQSLTPEIGSPELIAQIYKVISLMQVSNNWGEFKSLFNKMVDRNNGELELDFDAVENSLK